MVKSVTEYEVTRCERGDVKEFIEEWHYSASINGLRISYCYKMMDGDRIVGAMVYGKMAMANQWAKYGDSEDEVIELRRLCCIDDTPKNAESYFIGKSLRDLAENTDIQTVVSYADPFYEHSGVIYQATNFEHVGMTAAGRVIDVNGRLYHDKTIRAKYKGKIKPYAQRIINALEDGTAFYRNTPSKHIYVYKLYEHSKRKKRRNTKIERGD